jgi:hypothetical protein
MNKLTGIKLRDALDQVVRDLFKIVYKDNPACFTCDRKDGWYHPINNKKGIQVGHFKNRGHIILRWDLKNLFPQCSKCNVIHNINVRPFTKAVKEKIGQHRLDYLNNTIRKFKSKKMTTTEKRELLIKLKEKCKTLNK